MRYLVPLALLLSLASCRKDNGNTQPATASYRISGLQNIEVQAGLFGTTDIISNAELFVACQSGATSGKSVKLQLAGLPASITGKLSVDSGVPDFSTRLNVYGTNIAAGKYPAKVTLKAEGETTVQEFPFDISVVPAISCSDYLLSKTYVRRFTGGTRGGSHSVTLTLVDPAASLYRLDGFTSTGPALNAKITCNPLTFIIPEQQIGDTLFSSSGGLSGGTTQELRSFSEIYLFAVASNGGRVVYQCSLDVY